MTDTPSTEIAANSTDQPTGTLEHLDPASLELVLSDRQALTGPSSAGHDVENAFATRRRGYAVVSED